MLGEHHRQARARLGGEGRSGSEALRHPSEQTHAVALERLAEELADDLARLFEGDAQAAGLLVERDGPADLQHAAAGVAAHIELGLGAGRGRPGLVLDVVEARKGLPGEPPAVVRLLAGLDGDGQDVVGERERAHRRAVAPEQISHRPAGRVGFGGEEGLIDDEVAGDDAHAVRGHLFG